MNYNAFAINGRIWTMRDKWILLKEEIPIVTAVAEDCYILFIVFDRISYRWFIAVRYYKFKRST
jgi:hypothetical protein